MGLGFVMVVCLCFVLCNKSLDALETWVRCWQGCGGFRLWWHGPWWCNGSVGVMGHELWVVGFVVWVVARYSVLFRFKFATMVVVGGVTRLLGSGGEWLKGT